MHDVLMPKLGQTMEEATVARWLKKEGDAVSRGEVLLEITTDKATLEVESFYAGVLRKIVAPEGAIVPVNRLIAYIGQPDEPIPQVPSDTAEPAVVPTPTPRAAPTKEAEPALTPAAPSAVAATPSGGVKASPRARKLAEREHVPLRVPEGSGPGGRVTESDVEAYLERRAGLRVSPVALRLAYQRGIDVLQVQGTGPGGKVTKGDVSAAPVGPVSPARGRVEELSAMRRVIAQRMTESKTTIPHYYLVTRVDATDLVELRRRFRRERQERISHNALLLAACARALGAVPQVNRRWTDRGIEELVAIDIGLAVALEDGLVVPVVRGVDGLTVQEIHRASRELIEKARSKHLTPDDYAGGSLTLTSLGMYGIDFFIPIINPGQSAILSVGQMVEEPVVHLGEVTVRTMVKLVLSADHRVIDGVVGARFLEEVRTALEHPDRLPLS